MFDLDTPREAKRFRVNHPNGYVEINVGTFFGTSPQKKVNKLLRLARKYCTEGPAQGVALQYCRGGQVPLGHSR